MDYMMDEETVVHWALRDRPLNNNMYYDHMNYGQKIHCLDNQKQSTTRKMLYMHSLKGQRRYCFLISQTGVNGEKNSIYIGHIV